MPSLVQSSKDKIDQLRKAFTNTKEGSASKSTKNLTAFVQ